MHARQIQQTRGQLARRARPLHAFDLRVGYGPRHRPVGLNPHSLTRDPFALIVGKLNGLPLRPSTWNGDADGPVDAHGDDVSPRPRVPVFLGAFGEQMVRAAGGGWCDEVRPPGTWDTRYLEHVRGLLPEGVELGCDVWVSLDADRERARDLARTQLTRFLPQMKAITDFYGVDPSAPVTDEVLDLFFAAGNPSDVDAGLRKLLQARPATVMFSGRLGPDPARAIGWLAEMTR